MPHFAFIGHDKPGALDLRMQNRPAHVKFLKANAIPIAGPMTNEAGDMIGSLVVCEAASLADAEALFAQDPYTKAGLFASSSVTPWNWVIGNPKS